MELARGYLRVSPTSFALVLRHAVSGTWHRMKWCWQLLMDRWPPKNHLILLRSRSFLYLDDVCVHGNSWQSTCNQQSDVALTQHNCSLCTKPVREIFHIHREFSSSCVFRPRDASSAGFYFDSTYFHWSTEVFSWISCTQMKPPTLIGYVSKYHLTVCPKISLVNGVL